MAARLSSTHGLKTWVQKRKGETPIGFVPTMGALHEGHLSLIRRSKSEGCETLVSVFVNPAQFGPNEDFDAYPRQHERDFAMAKEAGADALWFPARDDLYCSGPETRIDAGELANRLCGVSRPVFFGGICTVVMKLFQLANPDRAYFGEKDFQQLTIIKRMVSDFYLDVEIVGCPTVREPDGLAMSSRNAYLGDANRSLALTLIQMIRAAQEAFASGHRRAASLRDQLLRVWPDALECDYLELRNPENLDLVDALKPETRLFIGAWLDGIRLIDNAPLAPRHS